jgi:hypothetical protein
MSKAYNHYHIPVISTNIIIMMLRKQSQLYSSDFIRIDIAIGIYGAMG